MHQKKKTRHRIFAFLKDNTQKKFALYQWQVFVLYLQFQSFLCNSTAVTIFKVLYNNTHYPIKQQRLHVIYHEIKHSQASAGEVMFVQSSIAFVDSKRLFHLWRNAVECPVCGRTWQVITGSWIKNMDASSRKSLSFANVFIKLWIIRYLEKSNLHYTRGITLKRVTSDGTHFCGLAPGQQSSEETSQRWRQCVRFDWPGRIRTSDLPHR